MRVIPSICALLLGIVAALFAGCGDRSNLIPARDADALKTHIAAVQAAANGRDCGASDKALNQARATVTNLPGSVDDRLRERLTSGLNTLASKAGTECNQAPITTTTTVPTTTTTETVPETTSTETTPPTTSTDTTPSTPVDPTTTQVDPGGTVTPAPSTTGSTPPPDPGGAAPVDPGAPQGGGR